GTSRKSSIGTSALIRSAVTMPPPSRADFNRRIPRIVARRIKECKRRRGAGLSRYILDRGRRGGEGGAVAIAGVSPAALWEQAAVIHLRLRAHEMPEERRAVPEADPGIEALRAIPVYRAGIDIRGEMNEMAEDTVLRRAECQTATAGGRGDPRVIVGKGTH